ncbi:MAG TPA: DinB family protein [Pyrinomonadaceae bacterium]|nr:DinB family protein [Pyrinomonadaceae bacterium]
MHDELENYRSQFDAIKRDAHGLLSELALVQLVWRPNAESWSIADCLNHLVVTGNQSLPRIRAALTAPQSRQSFGLGAFPQAVFGNLLIRWMDAPPKIRFKAPKAYRPALNLPADKIVNDFFLLQEEIISCLKESQGMDLARIKVSNPVSTWLKLSLGQEFALAAAHERRHLWQAWRVREKQNLQPTSPPNKSYPDDWTN